MEKHQLKHNALEKIVFGLGVLFLLVLVSYLVYQLQQEKNEPPILVVQTLWQEEMKALTYKVRVENKGEETAEGANINFALFEDGEKKNTATLTLDYIPPESTEIGWIVFEGRQRPGDSIVVTSLSFIEP